MCEDKFNFNKILKLWNALKNKCCIIVLNTVFELDLIVQFKRLQKQAYIPTFFIAESLYCIIDYVRQKPYHLPAHFVLLYHFYYIHIVQITGKTEAGPSFPAPELWSFSHSPTKPVSIRFYKSLSTAKQLIVYWLKRECVQLLLQLQYPYLAGFVFTGRFILFYVFGTW